MNLKDEEFFDPLGFYFNADGLDCNRGSYDEAGYYIPGPPRDKSLQALSKTEVMELEGKYDLYGFYQLKAGGFIDPFGYRFDENGLDPVGGLYEDGLYMNPDEEYKSEDEY